ncbi:MAG: DUF4194 domain-containing protein [Clostridia bacterium]|nr:DUF4194 domain-containing protein [Clostridia bacterium]
MWSEDFEKLSAYEKCEFRRIGNYLLSHTYMVRYIYDASEQMTLLNSDYQMATRLYSLLYDYFAVTGWQLEKDDTYGMMSLINIFDNNRLRIDRFTTLFLYTCRLIYEEEREHSSSFHIIRTDTQSVVEKMRTLGLLEKGKSTQKERIEAQRTLAHYNIIQKMEKSAWNVDGNQILILPSILMIVSNQGINDMMIQFEEMKIEPTKNESTDEYVEGEGNTYEITE